MNFDSKFSNKTFDGHGYIFDNINIYSSAIEDRLENFTLKNCIVKNIRLRRPSRDISIQDSSRLPNHVERIRSQGPTNITITGCVFKPEGEIPLYIGTGCSDIIVNDNQFLGKSDSTTIYCDAETTKISIINNLIKTKTGREHIAIDASDYNLIKTNRFENLGLGGIFLYRNCGEQNTIRHTKPQHNNISENIFVCNSSDSKPAIWLGSRNGNRCYCFQDPKYPFGSSLNSGDFAYNNKVVSNIFYNRSPCSAIRVNSGNNTIYWNNRKGEKKSKQPEYGTIDKIRDIYYKIIWRFICLFGGAKTE